MQGYFFSMLTVFALVASLTANATQVEKRRISHSTLRIPTINALHDGKAEVSGHALQGTTLRLLVNGEPTPSVTTDRKTFWRIPIKVNQAGEHKITIQQMRNDLVTWSSNPLPVKAPYPPSVDFPIDGKDYKGDYLIVTGRGLPHQAIDLLLSGQTVATTQATANGEWQQMIAVGSASYSIQAEYPGSLIRPSRTVNVTITRASITADKCQRAGLDLGTHYKKGPCETFGQIAAKLGVAKSELMRANADMQPQQDPGHHNWLRVPPRRKGMVCGTEGFRDGDVYVVGNCDNIAYISKRFNYHMKSLAWFNPKIAKGDTHLNVGELIRLPTW